MVVGLSAEQFVEKLQAASSAYDAVQLSRFFKTGVGQYGEGDVFIGVRMGQVFKTAKEFIDLPLSEVEKLLRSPLHEVRAGGLSIMNQQARSKKTTPERRKDLFDLYLKNTDKINNWDLVDVSAPYVIGSFLFDKPRDVLYKLARSKNIWERRTAIISTLYFIRQNDLDDTFKIAEILLNDNHDLIHKAIGWMLRETGKKDRSRLLKFLDQHAATMPRTSLRYSIEHLDKELRAHYMSSKKQLA